MTRNEFGALDYPYVDWSHVDTDDEPFVVGFEWNNGEPRYTGAWITGALLVAAALVAVLVWRWLR